MCSRAMGKELVDDIAYLQVRIVTEKEKVFQRFYTVTISVIVAKEQFCKCTLHAYMYVSYMYTCNYI